MPGSRIAERLRAATRSAFHLELRDGYSLDDPDWHAWRSGQPLDVAASRSSWSDTVRDAVARGVVIRRLRVVSEPISEYIRYEYDITHAHNIAAGEDVRWLARRDVSDVFLPPSDFWAVDDLVLFNHFDGNGNWIEEEERPDADLTRRVVEAFALAWERGTPHGDYRPLTK